MPTPYVYNDVSPKRHRYARNKEFPFVAFSLEESLPTRPAHCPFHTLQTHTRKARTTTIPIPLVSPECLSQVRRRQRPLVTSAQSLL